MTGSRAPLVSVIVPCRNEARHIGRFLEGLLRDEYPRDRLEVKFVDGRSTDGTREILRDAQRRHPFIEVLDNPRLIAPAAMNLGIRAARGEFIVRMDAHSLYPPDYIARCLRLLRQTPGAGNAGGAVVNEPNGDGPWARAVAFVTAHPFGVGGSPWRTGGRPGPVDTVPWGAFPRAVLEEVGLFDERLTRGQDHELNARLRRRGYKIVFDPTIQVRYWNQGTLGGLARQGFQTSMWNAFNLSLHPYTWRWRRFAPAAFVLYLAGLAAAPSRRASLPLAAYLALLAACARGGRAHGGALRAAATFGSYHLCYGLGTHFGLLNLLLGRRGRYLGRPLR